MSQQSEQKKPPPPPPSATEVQDSAFEDEPIPSNADAASQTQTEEQGSSDPESEDDSDSDFDADEPVFVPEEQYVPLDDEYEPLGDEGSNGGNGDDSESVDVDINIEREIEARMHQELFSDLDTSSAVDEPASQAAPAAQLPQMARQIRPLEVDVAHGSRMTADHVDQIKGIMAGIHISNHGIPEWAKIVPESAWMPKRKPSSDGDSAGSGEKR